VVDGKLYALGGYRDPTDDRGWTNLDTVEVYDPATDTWAAMAPMLTARMGLAAAVVDGKLFALGGIPHDFEYEQAYDPATNTWAAVAPMPTHMGFGLAAAVVDGKLYALGGDGLGNDYYLDTVVVYDPPSSLKIGVAIGAAAGGVALLASVAAAIVIKRRRALDRQQAARLTMARGSASPSLASV